MGPVGLPRDEVSTHGDDGSLRLLAAPAVLVVVVLLLLVTACSGASGEETRTSGDGGDATAVAASGKGDKVRNDKSGVDKEGGDAGSVLPAEISEDGRMLQPDGHKGIWFETAPGDPLGKLVYESQRFVGDPVELELLGDRALMPEWADMPDLCTGEVLDRLKELGLRESHPTAIGAGIASCAGVAAINPDGMGDLGDINWGTVADLSAYDEGIRVNVRFRDDFVSVDMLEPIGCFSFVPSVAKDLYIYSSTWGGGGERGCAQSASLLQALVNITGEVND